MDASPNPAPIDTLVAGRYAIDSELGRGGFGVVYLARDLQLHAKPVVIKCLLLGSGQPVDWVMRKFEEEINALAAIDHPGVVRISDAGKTASNVPYLVMDYIEGVTLRALMGREELDLRRVAGVVRQIASALTAAHANGIIHRDLKPENVMIQTLASGEDHVRLIDFGIASFKAATRAATTGETMVAGTAQYMAPEQFRGQPSTASDVYALGVITYELITRRYPSAAGSDIVPPRSIRPDLPEAAQQLIVQALKVSESGRPSALEFGERFYRAIEGTATPSPMPVPERALDVAMAKEVPVHEPAELVALIRQIQSEGLKGILESDPDFSVTAEDVRSKPLTLEFPLDPYGRPSPIDLTLKIDSPDFEPKSQNKLIRVPPFADSEPYTFLLTPMALGELRVNVELYAGDVALFSRTLRTRARTSDRIPAGAPRAILTIPLTVFVQASPGAFTGMFGVPAGGEFTRMIQIPPVTPPQYTRSESDATGVFASPSPPMKATPPPVGVEQPAPQEGRRALPSKWMVQAAVAALVCVVAVGLTTTLFTRQKTQEFAVVRPKLEPPPPLAAPQRPIENPLRPAPANTTAAPRAARTVPPQTQLPAEPAARPPIASAPVPRTPTSLFEVPERLEQDGPWWKVNGDGYLFLIPGINRVAFSFPASGANLSQKTQWVVHYTSDRNYIAYEIDQGRLTRRIVLNGVEQQPVQSTRTLAADSETYRVSITVEPRRIIVSSNQGDRDVYTNEDQDLTAGKIGIKGDALFNISR